MFKIKNTITRKRCEIGFLIIYGGAGGGGGRGRTEVDVCTDVFIVNFEQYYLLSLNK